MTRASELRPLDGVRVLSLAINVPGPVAAARLQALGAAVTKIEPPGGDPLARFAPAWYRSLIRGQQVLGIDLKAAAGRTRLDELLDSADLLLTSMRPAALERLALDPETVQRGRPALAQVAILGHPRPHADRAGHDLTYQAAAGLLAPGDMPGTLVADLAAAEIAVSTALSLLLARARGQVARYAEVTLQGAAEAFAVPLAEGLTGPGALLGGGHAGYNVYRAAEGWIALAALEPHFWERLRDELALLEGTPEELARVFLTRTATQWERWAEQRDLPLVALREHPPEQPRS